LRTENRAKLFSKQNELTNNFKQFTGTTAKCQLHEKSKKKQKNQNWKKTNY